MWRWSFVTAGLIALFWVFYSLVVGNVPTITVLGDEASSVTINMSRWWDVLIGPACTILIVLFFTGTKKGELEKAALVGPGSIVIGLTTSWLIATTQDLEDSLQFVTIYGLVLGLVVFWLGDTKSKFLKLLEFGLFSGLVCCLTTAMISGLGVGLLLFIIIGIATVIGAGLAEILKGIGSILRMIWKKFPKWLMAKEEEED